MRKIYSFFLIFAVLTLVAVLIPQVVLADPAGADLRNPRELLRYQQSTRNRVTSSFLSITYIAYSAVIQRFRPVTLSPSGYSTPPLNRNCRCVTLRFHHQQPPGSRELTVLVRE